MKVSSGWAKGLKLQTPEGLDTRPTRERVRQAAINMLQPWIPGARVLDLFAGSGAVGLELVSRGASGAGFIEISPAAIKCLRSNMAEAKSRAEKQSVTVSPWFVETTDVMTYIKTIETGAYDLIWADPPYDLIPHFLDGFKTEVKRVLSGDGVFILESSIESKEVIDQWSNDVHLQIIKQREYGVTLITILGT